MSKKKSTMTLKDFHGGSIPSDLPLPSAPGVVVRPNDRPGYDRQSSWGSSINRSSDHRLRPNSSGSMRSLDDKTPFLSTNVNIGRNFDEDERKPLDGGSAPRRPVSDDGIHAPVMRSETHVDAVRYASLQSSGLGVGAGIASSYSPRIVEGAPSSGGMTSMRANPWGVRREAVSVNGTVSPAWDGGHNTLSKFAQASALDQISSGRWQTKPVHNQADVEVIRPLDSPSSLYVRESDYRGGPGGGVSFENQGDHYEPTLVRHMERGLGIGNLAQGGFKEIPSVERKWSPSFDGKERSPVLFTNEGQPAHPEAKYGNSESQSLPDENVFGRPKLKLIPRSKPMDVPKPSVVDYKHGLQQPVNTIQSEINVKSPINGSHVNPGSVSSEPFPPKAGVANGEASSGLAERPKLNLKPRSQPLDPSEGRTERERIALFGGARPRESVLKERVVDDVVNSQDEAPGSSRLRNDLPRTEVAPVHASSFRHIERPPNVPTDHRTTRGHEKKDQRADVQKAEMQRKSWRNENWRNKDTGKQQQDRQPSPETWRKPVEQSKASDTDHSGLRYGKAVSAVELAQAFSKPASDPKPIDHYPGQRGISGRTQAPFSRLTGSTRAQINGY